MTQFMGNHQNRLDAKMRVSVPSPFRAALRAHGGILVLRSSHKFRCIEAWPEPVFETFASPLQRLDLFSETQDDLALSLYGDACTVEPDKEGRVVLPEHLAAHAELTDSVIFIGAGRSFQIWEPEAGQKRLRDARERTRANGLTLPGVEPARPTIMVPAP